MHTLNHTKEVRQLALMTFGNLFVLVLYDKWQRAVTSSTAPTSARQAPAPQRISAAAAPIAEVGLEPLDRATIQQILATVLGCPRPALEGFTKAFRQGFQMPADVPSIADRIHQRRHQDWIETFLMSHQSVRPADNHEQLAA